MVSVVVWFVIGYVSLMIHLITLGVLFFVQDVKLGLRNFVKKRFRLKRTNSIYATIIKPNKSKESNFFKIDDKGTFKLNDATYNVNHQKSVTGEDGYPTGVWEEGNGTQLDLYGTADKDRSSAHLQDAAIKMALAAGDQNPFFETLQRTLKWILMASIGAFVAAALALYLVWNLGGGIGGVGGTQILA